MTLPFERYDRVRTIAKRSWFRGRRHGIVTACVVLYPGVRRFRVFVLWEREIWAVVEPIDLIETYDPATRNTWWSRFIVWLKS